jgi:hypothetical protein
MRSSILAVLSGLLLTAWGVSNIAVVFSTSKTNLSQTEEMVAAQADPSTETSTAETSTAETSTAETSTAETSTTTPYRGSGR